MELRTTAWIIAAVCATIFVTAMLAEQRRARRRDPDRVGFMPWTLVQLLAILATVLSVALALTGE
ncbi:hypothetical protein IFT55_09240 [Sphingomonas sp. CFBP 13720]|nr:hypothetical protein [Sphingomonas sp. CFBP 13720]